RVNGNSILKNLRKNEAPCISAASSSSELICIILLVPEREAKGSSFTIVIKIMIDNVPYRAGTIKNGFANNVKYIAESAIPGTRYGKNDNCSTIFPVVDFLRAIT